MVYDAHSEGPSVLDQRAEQDRGGWGDGGGTALAAGWLSYPLVPDLHIVIDLDVGGLRLGVI